MPTQGVVGVLTALVVDGEGVEMGEIAPCLVRQIRQGGLRNAGVHLQALRIGIDSNVPVAQLAQQGVGTLGALSPAQLAQRAAAGALAQGQGLDLAEMSAVFGKQLSGSQPFHEIGPGAFRGGLGLARGAFASHFRRRVRSDLRHRAAEIQPLGDELPSQPRRWRRIGAINQLGQFGQGRITARQ